MGTGRCRHPQAGMTRGPDMQRIKVLQKGTLNLTRVIFLSDHSLLSIGHSICGLVKERKSPKPCWWPPFPLWPHLVTVTGGSSSRRSPGRAARSQQRGAGAAEGRRGWLPTTPAPGLSTGESRKNFLYTFALLCLQKTIQIT